MGRKKHDEDYSDLLREADRAYEEVYGKDRSIPPGIPVQYRWMVTFIDGSSITIWGASLAIALAENDLREDDPRIRRIRQT